MERLLPVKKKAAQTDGKPGLRFHQEGVTIMPTTNFDVASIKESIVGKLQRYYGLTVSEANSQQIYRAVASTVRDQIMKKWMTAVCATASCPASRSIT